jgi:N-methylhydantoinase A
MADLSLGIDIGGTFTDIVVYDPGTGRHHIWKEPTTPGDPAEGVVAGIKGLLATGVGHEPIRGRWRRQALSQHVLLQRRHGRDLPPRRADVSELAE